MKLDPFYLIVDGAAWIARLVPLGVRLVQLRIKEMEHASLMTEIRAAKAICEKHGCQLIVNDHWQAAIEAGGNFVHLGQEDLASADLKAIRRAGLRLGLSTHDPTELETALKVEPDYVALGPIYPTVLKEMKWQPQGLHRLTAWKARIGAVPLVGIGGLNPDRATGVLKHGANAAAVVTDITLNADPEARTREWITATQAWR